ncbi:membrane protein [soil metagenome]
MTATIDETRSLTEDKTWLSRYYFTRAAFSLVWVGAAFSVADSKTAVVAALLLIYPAWDAVANTVDAQRNGGFRRNPTQVFNAVVSLMTTLAVGVALTQSMNAVLAVFGVWAAFSGLLQLATGVRRWKSFGGQWPMILSGIQSTAAGGMFLVEANAPALPQISAIAPYAAFGAFYFLISAIWLTVSEARRRRA